MGENKKNKKKKTLNRAVPIKVLPSTKFCIEQQKKVFIATEEGSVKRGRRMPVEHFVYYT